MSTRCEIGVMNEDGSITAQYCHHDGYPQGVGRELLSYYNREAIEEVIHRGQLDALEESGPVYYDDENEDDLSSTYRDLDEFLEKGADHDFHYYLDLSDRWHVIDMHWNDETHCMSGKKEDDKLLSEVLDAKEA